MSIEFFESDFHAGRKEIVKGVFSNTFSLRLIQEMDHVINATRDQRVEHSECIRHWSVREDTYCQCMLSRTNYVALFVVSKIEVRYNTRMTEVRNVNAEAH